MLATVASAGTSASLAPTCSVRVACAATVRPGNPHNLCNFDIDRHPSQAVIEMMVDMGSG